MNSIESIRSAIEHRSKTQRALYLERMQRQSEFQKANPISCSNQAHAIAATSAEEKSKLLKGSGRHLGIVTAYNDMLSAHQPYATYPEKIKRMLATLGHTAQVAGGVPAMCDGVTQGQPGMEMSLFSRDVIAQATIISLSHNTFDAIALLGICDKIAPGMLMGALNFGHLPCAFIPSGPMTTGASNDEKVIVRQQYAAGKADRDALLAMECKAYHSEGTCTFYGTANTNQLVFEAMGLMLPGSAFVPPNTPLREALTAETLNKVIGQNTAPNLMDVIDARSIVNGLVALLASGGSTNHTIHLLAVAQAAGYIVTWEDIDNLSKITPLLTRIYPNGSDDINAFESAGGVPALLNELATIDLLFMGANTLVGQMEDQLKQPSLEGPTLTFEPISSLNQQVITPSHQPFHVEGGLKLVQGNLGRGMIKTSALKTSELTLKAPVYVYQTQEAVLTAIRNNDITNDCFIAVTHNGPAANGMPELHQLIPSLNNLMANGITVVLLTDGRLSGASGKVPAVLHLCPEAAKGGPLSKLKNGDELEIDLTSGELNCCTDLADRTSQPLEEPTHGYFGTPMFEMFRQQVTPADQGASVLFK
jgi:phosphogluconate dehydratase